MLQLVLGRAGSGKTEYIRAELETLVEAEEDKLILLVPEQASFENERAMLKRLGAKNGRHVQVLSFTRLTDWVFRICGGMAGKRLSDGGRNILMSLALEATTEQLTLYKEHVKTPELLSMMLTISTEMKMCAVSSHQLLEARLALQDRDLQEKMKEVSLILSAYDALVSQTYLDPLDDLSRLKNTLENNNFFEGYTIYVDAFSGFTAQEYDILGILMRQAKNIIVSLCMDEKEKRDDFALFAPTQATFRKLKRLAKDNSVFEASPIQLEAGKRFESKALLKMEETIFRGKIEEIAEGEDGITIYCANNHYNEADYVATTIRSLIIEKNYRYQDFAIIVRSMENYNGNLDIALEKWNIPFFMDKARSIDAEPLMRLVLSAFQVVKSNFQSEAVFACLKTELFALTTQEISLLENYTFLWKISGKQWLSLWTDHPGGFVEGFSDEDQEELAKINLLRNSVVDPLADFAQDLANADGEAMAKALYRFLEQIQVPEHIKQLYYKLKALGDIETAQQQLRLWDMLMEILDQSALTLKGQFLSTQRYADLLRLVIAAESITSIPQGLDEVSVGVADRMRPAQPKVVFLLGATQGDFPANQSATGLFNDDERRALIRAGLPLTDSLEQAAVEERFLAYTAMTSPSQWLYLTYPSAGSDGEMKLASVMISEVQKLFPSLQEWTKETLSPEIFANAEKPAFELMARKWRQDTSLSATLREVFQKRENYGAKLKSIEHASKKTPIYFESKEKAKKLFSGKGNLSASQIENYHLCRFQYFCRYGMNIRERKAAEMNALEYGNLIHFLLEYFLKNFGSEKIIEMTEEDLKEEIMKQVYSFIELKMGGAENKSIRFIFQFDRMADSAQVVLRHIAKELLQSDFKPILFEAALQHEGDYPPLQIPMKDGEKVHISGKIDRIDIMETEGKQYVRIVDYKTGSKKFKLEDILSGVNMQMLIYLAAVIENGPCEPAGILYMPATRPILPVDHSLTKEEYQKKLNSELKMNGLVLGESGIVQGMGKDYISKGDKSENLMNQKDFNSILKHVKKLTVDMQENLYEGNIEANPLKGIYNACEYCPYFAICNHEKEDGGKEIFHCNKAEILKKIEEKEDKDE